MAQQPENGASCAVIVPHANISINDKAMLIEDLHLPPQLGPRPITKKKSGQLTWLMAAVALPTVAILLLLSLFLLAEPMEPRINQRAPAKLTRTLRNNIFVIDVNVAGFPTDQKISQLETILKSNQNSDVYQITLTRSGERHERAAFDRLRKKFKAFHYLFQTAGSFFKGSLYENHAGGPREMLFKAQLLILWRYGGTVLSPNWVTLKPIEGIQKTDKNLVVGGYNGALGFMSVSNTCNAKIYDIMSELENSKSSVENEMEIIDQVMTKSNKGIKKLTFPETCNNRTVSTNCIFMRTVAPDLPIVVVKSAENTSATTDNRLVQYLQVIPSYFHKIFILSP